MRSWRLAAAALSIAVALAMAFAVVAILGFRGRAFTLVDVLVAPIALVFYLGPSLLTLAMASRSRSVAAAAVALAIAVLLAGGLEALRATPWHFGYWRGNSGDAETTLLIGVLIFFWPLTAVGSLPWLALNRRS